MPKLSDLATVGSLREKGKPTIYRASIGQAGAQAATAEDAVIALRRKVKDAFSGSYQPQLLFFREHIGLLWREAANYGYTILDPTYIGKYDGTLKHIDCCTLYATKEETEKHLRSHLAQYTWDHEEETSPIIENEESQEAFTDWTRLQKRYKKRHNELKAEGQLSDDEIMRKLNSGDF